MFFRSSRWVETVLTVGPALLLAAIAILLWRRYWSMRFWLAAAFLYWLIPWGNRAIFDSGNGVGIRHRHGAPASLVEPFYCVSEFAWPLFLILMALGLLSFHPATRWVDTARYRNVVVAGCLLIAGSVLGWISSRATWVRTVPALDPSEYYKDRATATSITVAWEPVREVMESDAAAFRIVLTNTGATDLHLNGLPIGAIRFRPEPFFNCRRDDGRLTEWGTGLKVPADQELLGASESRTFLVEVPVAPHPIENDSLSWLLPGDYTAFVTLFLQKEHTFEKVVSNVVHFRIAASSAN